MYKVQFISPVDNQPCVFCMITINITIRIKKLFYKITCEAEFLDTNTNYNWGQLVIKHGWMQGWSKASSIGAGRGGRGGRDNYEQHTSLQYQIVSESRNGPIWRNDSCVNKSLKITY